MAETAGEAERGPSRLAASRSAYLRAAAEQAIDWHPWGAEAFDVARRTHRPILLDIGASWCHWCHVMDEGTYSDPEVERLLRQHFVAVKVDRDEHPEIDRRYQRQIGALTGEGGWPLTGFLTPEGEVFLGGTYFPPTDGHGRPGFRRLLQEVARLWKEEPTRIAQNTRSVRDALHRMTSSPSVPAADVAPFVASVGREISGSFDPANGGYGVSPKFPHPTVATFLLWDEFANGHRSSGEQVRDTLQHMADGGLWDQVGGGFHRYSVDEAWRIPHFEKMGIDNAELLLAYADGYRRFGDPRFAAVIRGITGWAGEVLADRQGGWGASQDADNAPGDDGSYFTWSRSELRNALGPEEFRLSTRFFGVGTEGRMPHDPDRNVLFRLLTLSDAADGLSLSRRPEDVLSSALQQLREARDRRPSPTVDHAQYASINGRFLSGWAAAGSVLGSPVLLDEARRAADRWLGTAVTPDRGIAHRLGPDGPAVYGLLEDQVAFARGLLDLAVALAEPRYLPPAEQLLGLVDREYRGEGGVLRDLAPRLYDGPEVAGVGEPSYPLEDSPHLSANAGAALAFIRLGAVLHDEQWTEKARGLIAAIVPRIHGAGLFAAGSALAAGLLSTPPASVVVEGTGPAADALLQAARRCWHPNVCVFQGHPPAPFSLPELAALPASVPVRALVCFGTSCAPPITEPNDLVRVLTAGRPVG